MDTLGSQLMTQLEDDVDPGGRHRPTTGSASCSGLAVATTTETGQAPEQDADVDPAEPGRRRAGDPAGTPGRRGAVRPGAARATDSDAADDPIYAGLLAGLAEQTVATVVAADTADGADGRLARAARGDRGRPVATVDGVDTAAGQVHRAAGPDRVAGDPGRAFGASGADGAVGLR